jgi:hypothetical protein
MCATKSMRPKLMPEDVFCHFDPTTGWGKPTTIRVMSNTYCHSVEFLACNSKRYSHGLSPVIVLYCVISDSNNVVSTRVNRRFLARVNFCRNVGC